LFKEVYSRVVKEDGFHRWEQGLAFRLKISGGPGFFRAWDPTAVLTYAVSILVLLRLPSQVLGLFALNFLGHLSAIYRRATIHTFNVTDQCGVAALQLLQSASSFKSLADIHDLDGQGTQAISREAFHARLSEALHCMSDVLSDHQIRQLTALCLEIVCRPPPSRVSLSNVMSVRQRVAPASGGSVSRKQFQQTCLLNEDIDLASMAELFDENRSQWPLERFFTESAFSTNRRDMMSPVDSESL